MRQAPVLPAIQPDAALGAIVGDNPIPRTEITSRVWAYINQHKLKDGRNIVADEKLKAVFNGADRIDAFRELQRFISAHVSKVAG